MAAHSDAEPTTTPAYDPEARDLARPEDRRKFAEWVAHIVRAAGDEEGAALIQAAGFMPNGVREAFPKTQRGGSEISPKRLRRDELLRAMRQRRYAQFSPGPAGRLIWQDLENYRATRWVIHRENEMAPPYARGETDDLMWDLLRTLKTRSIPTAASISKILGGRW